MNHYCKYHPGTEALWYCSHDGLFLCQQCVDGKDQDLTEARCLLCNHKLDEPEPQNKGPLWRHLDQYLGFPLTPQLLPVALIWALISAVLPPLLVMLPVALLGGAPVWRFATALMTLRSRPRRAHQKVLPGWQCLSESAGWQASLLQALPPLLIMGAAGVLMALVSVPLGLLVAVLGLSLVPALWLAIQVQGAKPGSYLAAAVYIASAPRDYGVAVLLSVLGWCLGAAVVAVALDLLPMFLVQGLAGLLVACWWLALAALCGDILLRHGRQWGLRQGARRVIQPLPERRQWLQLCAGRFDKVLLTTAQEVKSKKATLADWHRFDRLLAVLKREQDRQASAEDYLEVLIANQAWRDAVQLVQRQRKGEAGWLPPAPGVRLALAKGIYEWEPKLAVALLQGLHDSHRDFSGLGDAYLLLARVLAEKFQLPGKAEQYLKFVESQCRDVRLRQEAAQVRQALAG